MLYRKIIEEFKSWKENENTSLLVYGARQVGKTYLIREFCKDSFSHLYEINFSENIVALNTLLTVSNYDGFVKALSFLLPNLPREGDVLFFDEIQIYYEERNKRIEKDPTFASNYVDILTLSKTIVDQASYRFILSGSLLGITLFNIHLNPAGYLKEITMNPLDFEEYLLACNVSKEAIDNLKESFKNKEAINPIINEEIIKKFKEYILVGGMPRAVDVFIKKNDYKLVTDTHYEIINWYKSDIIKYAPIGDRLVISMMYEALASQINEKNRKFIKSHLEEIPNYKNLQLEDKLLWLSNSGIAIPTYNVHNATFPLKASKDYKVVKLFANDVGLLTTMLFETNDKKKIFDDDSDIDFGAVYENVAAELLLAHNIQPFYKSMKKDGEIDFVTEKRRSIIPIEIKSNRPNKLGLYEHKALDKYLDNYKDTNEAYLFGLTNINRINQTLTYYPIYMIEFFRNER